MPETTTAPAPAASAPEKSATSSTPQRDDNGVLAPSENLDAIYNEFDALDGKENEPKTKEPSKKAMAEEPESDETEKAEDKPVGNLLKPRLKRNPSRPRICGRLTRR
jgi:hypothetical protein